MIDGYYPETYVSIYRLQILLREANIAKLNKPPPRPPFEQWWINSLDIVTDWNEIARIILD